MGASKRIAELVFQAAAAAPGTVTRFSIVRFGNVLGSSGSVVPLFQQQIARGGPITITHPDVIRYFMLISEAAQLVVQAGAMARGGEVFVLDMGEPVRILDLARTMIGLSGLTERNGRNPDGDIAIEFIGLFPGEKLYEELLIGDGAEPSEHPAIMRVREPSLVGPELAHRIKQLLQACQSNERRQIDAMLVALVPEFRTAPERPTRPVTTAVQRDISHANNTVRA
jgi:FlaA1/EpsC-like NDP-sugar epimerase